MLVKVTVHAIFCVLNAGLSLAGRSLKHVSQPLARTVVLQSNTAYKYKLSCRRNIALQGGSVLAKL